MADRDPLSVPLGSQGSAPRCLLLPVPGTLYPSQEERVLLELGAGWAWL